MDPRKSVNFREESLNKCDLKLNPQYAERFSSIWMFSE